MVHSKTDIHNPKKSRNPKPWRIGICGCGSSLFMYEGIQLPNKTFQLVAVADPNCEKRQLAIEKWGVRRTYSESNEMFENENLHLVIIATAPSTHLSLALKATQKGIHILVQKPLARTIEEAKQIMQSCKKNNVGLKVSFSRRYTPAFLEAKDLVDSLGQSYLLRVTWCSPSGIKPRVERVWKEELNTLGGILVDYGTHVVDVARWWMGEIKVGYLNLSIIKGELDNISSFLLQHTSGGNTICSLSNMEYSKKEIYEYIAAFGGFTLERKSDGYPGEWVLHSWKTGELQPKINYFKSLDINPFLAEINDFICSLKQGEIPIDPGNLGYNALQTTTLLYRSASHNKDYDLEKFSLKDFFQCQKRF